MKNHSIIRKGTIITVGFMPSTFNRIFDYSLDNFDILPKPVIIQKGFTVAHELFKMPEVVTRDFFSKIEIENLKKQSILHITHYGVGSLFNSLTDQLETIFVPRLSSFQEHKDDHQLELARLMYERCGVEYVTDYNKLKELIIKKTHRQYTEKRKLLRFSYPNFSHFQGKAILASSVGGHRDELSLLIQNSFPNVNVVNWFVDEKCKETSLKQIKLFPSCAKKWKTFHRIIQCYILIRKVNFDCVITSGAGVGSIFVFAAWLLGKEIFILESFTRVSSPSLWFIVSKPFADHVFLYETASWKTTVKNKHIIGIS